MAKADKKPEAEVPEVRGRQSAAPFCPYHADTRCRASHSEPIFTRYKCPVPGCSFSMKVPRPEMRRIMDTPPDEDFSAR